MDKEEQIREKVKELKLFYTDLLIYGAISIACVFSWAVTGGGPFWPIWVIFVFVAISLLKAARMGKLSSLGQFFPFLTDEWEEKQVKLMMKQATSKSETTPKKAKGSKSSGA